MNLGLPQPTEDPAHQAMGYSELGGERGETPTIKDFRKLSGFCSDVE